MRKRDSAQPRSICLGVRDFALPIPRRGSIEKHSGYGTMAGTAQKVHDQFLLLRSRSVVGRNYAKEVKVEHTFEISCLNESDILNVASSYETGFAASGITDELGTLNIALPNHADISEAALSNTTEIDESNENGEKLRRRSKVTLHRAKAGSFLLLLSGRVDGVVGSSWDEIEEIKTDDNIERLREILLRENDHPYWLQLKSYGYMRYLASGRVPELSLVLVSQRKGSHEKLRCWLDIEDYERWLHLRLLEIVDEFETFQGNKERRKALSARLSFPFQERRKGQQELMEEVSTAVTNGTTLLLQAPTGSGKTVGVMYPALQSSLSRGAQLIYVTPKNSQHNVARQAIERINETSILQKQDVGRKRKRNTRRRKGRSIDNEHLTVDAPGDSPAENLDETAAISKADAELKSLILTAKSKLCLKEQMICHPDYCEFAKDYYGKVYENDLVRVVSDHAVVDAGVLERYAREYEVCPFELSLDCIKNVDVVVGDYNYVFSPTNITGRFQYSLSAKKEKPELIIDEAHNLPARAESYYSASISVDDLRNFRRQIDALPSNLSGNSLAAVLDEFIKLIDQYRSLKSGTKYDDEVVDIDREHVRLLAEESAQFAAQYISTLEMVAVDDPVLSAHRTIEGFSSILEYISDEFKLLYKRTAGGTLKVVCCDASKFLADSYKLFNSTVAFSATLKPFEYYADLTGISHADADYRTRELLSPFPKKNRKLLVIPQVSTTYTDRRRFYSKIAEAIGKIVSIKPGNYVVFFPSFDFLQKVAELSEIHGSELVLQEKGISKRRMEDILSRLEGKDSRIVLFAVQGGVFSEGVDYPGDMLSGAIIVGPAIPTYDKERELLIRYYQERYGQGERYGLVYPAMAKAVQSAGRVIRSEHDRGLIVLMDRRFINQEFTSVMPGDWFDSSVAELVSQTILSDVKEFWYGGESAHIAK